MKIQDARGAGDSAGAWGAAQRCGAVEKWLAVSN